MKRFLLASLFVAACADNPFGRPATLVDGSEFPPAIRNLIAPKPAFHDGAQVQLYLLGDAPAEVASMTVLVGPDGQPLPRCVTRLRDANGVYIDADLEACQGAILPALPSDPAYTPFVRIAYASVSDDYEPNEARSADELADIGAGITPADLVVDAAVIDPGANVADPAGHLPRLIGWFEGLQLVYLEAASDVPVDAEGKVVSMDLLVPDGYEPGEGGDVLTIRAGGADYSPRCRVVTFRVPAGYMPGDIKSAAAIPVADRTPTDTYVHCVAP